MYKSILPVMVLGGVLVAMLPGCGGGPGEREFRSGKREYERGNYVRAMTLFEKSINERPGNSVNATTYNYLGLVSWKLDQFQRAIEAFEYSRGLDPSLVEPTYNLAMLLYESGDPVRAASLLEESAMADPADSRALEFLGSIYARAGKWQEARRVLFGALARSPKSPRVLTALAVAETHASGSDKAIFYLMQALEQKTDYPPALFNLGMIYRSDMKDNAQARAYLARYLDVAGDDPHAEIARRMVEELTGVSPRPVAEVPVAPAPAASAPIGRVERPVAPPPKTEVPSAARVETPPPQPPSGTRAFEALLRNAKAESEKGNSQAALNLCLEAADKAGRAEDKAFQEKALRECVKLCFDQPRAHCALGRFLYDRGQYEAALKAFKQAVILDPKFAPGQLGLADSAVKAGEIDAAFVAVKQAIQLEPNNPDALWSLAELYDKELAIPEKAAQAYRQFTDRFPGDPRVVKAQRRLNELAPPVQRTTPAQPAVRAPAPRPSVPPASSLKFKPTMVRNTHAAVQAYNRGTLYQQQEDWDRAIYYYTRAVENDDTFATAFFNLGSVYWARGEHGMAQAAYLQAVELQPDMIAARYNLALISRELKQRAAAIEQLKILLRDHADYAPGHYLLGMLYAEDPGTVGLAKAEYKTFLELAPNDPSAPVVRNWIKAH